jgi:hypothetical protein
MTGINSIIKRPQNAQNHSCLLFNWFTKSFIQCPPEFKVRIEPQEQGDYNTPNKISKPSLFQKTHLAILIIPTTKGTQNTDSPNIRAISIPISIKLIF